MPLSNQQHEAVLVMEWMMSNDHRRSGRTFAQAVALIRLAARNPGTRFSCFDHAVFTFGGVRDLNRNLVRQVREIIDRDAVLSRCVQWRNETFHFQNIRPIEDWWPRGSIDLPPEVAESEVESLFDSITGLRKAPLLQPPPAPVEGPSRWACL